MTIKTNVLPWLITTAFVAITAFGKDVPLTTVITERDIIVDGLSADWEGLALTFLEKQNASFGTALDSQYLYFLFRTNDQKYARLIKRGGLKIIIEPKNKDAYRLAFDFRGGPAMEKRPEGRGDNFGGEMPADLKQRFNEKPDSGSVFSCAVTEKGEPLFIPVDGGMGPMAAYTLENGFYSYEFAVPLKPSRAGFIGLGVKPPEEIKIEIVWNEMDTKNRGSGGGPMGGPGGGGGFGGQGPGGGGPPGGGMPGGPGGMRGQGNRGDFEKPDKQVVRFKTLLPSLQKTETK